jgi:acetyl-CoA C-acetyltransferase
MLAGDVCIVGVGMTAFSGKLHRDKTCREMLVEAALEAEKSVDKGIELRKDVDAVFVGYFTPEIYEHQSHIGPLAATWLGLTPKPAFRTEIACASSSAALFTGIAAIASGLCQVVLVAGIEKMTNLEIQKVTEALALASDDVSESRVGATFPGLYALLAQVYFRKYDATWEQLQSVTIKNHYNGSLNPKAHFQETIAQIAEKIGNKYNVKYEDELDFLKNSPFNRVIAYPLRLFDCCPISDGAAVAILASKNAAKKFTDTPLKILGVGLASDNLALQDRVEHASLRASRFAAESAYRMAGVKPKDVNIAEVHDCFTIAEWLAVEDLGFFERGEAAKAYQEGLTSLEGEIPVNTDGGLKAKGHPVGATGVGMLHEVWHQLRGTAGKRQIKNRAELGLIHNVGGSGASAAVFIVGR